MSKAYRGGIINFDGGRTIDVGEKVIVNADGRRGTVVDRKEGSYVFLYFLRFPEDDGVFSYEHPFKPDEITPVVNP